MKKTPLGWPRISVAVFYDDALAAIDWLCRAFEFEVRLKVLSPEAGFSTLSSSTATESSW